MGKKGVYPNVITQIFHFVHLEKRGINKSVCPLVESQFLDNERCDSTTENKPFCLIRNLMWLQYIYIVI